MKRGLNINCLVLVLTSVLTTVLCVGATKPANPADSAADKLDYIHRNGQKPHPESRPTELTEAEANAYFASGKVKMPAGVQSIHLTGDSGAITANCRIDFDQVKAGRGNSNPLLHLFSGVHDVLVQSDASGFNYEGHVHVNSVSIDGVEVPQFVLEVFVEKYVTPKYPGVGLDSTFRLPDKVETAKVVNHELTVVQR